jgi:L-ascorbate metabolism protein UlaG (beta-lactamase superfamily)
MMDISQAFSMAGRPEVPPGKLRLTRLNIYSGVYIEFARTRVLVDPSYVLPEIVPELRPDLILVSHESMDHFDPELCLSLLTNPQTELIGSWGVITALCGQLDPADPRWSRIHAGIPGAAFDFGDLSVKVELAQHCEYAVPVFFDLRDAQSGFRILDAIDTEITPAMTCGEVAPEPDLLIVPVGIAKAASPANAWEMVQLLGPHLVLASHFTTQAAEFRALAPAAYSAARVKRAALPGQAETAQFAPGNGSTCALLEADNGGTSLMLEPERLIVPEWFGGVTISGPDPEFRTPPLIRLAEPEAYSRLNALLPAGLYHLPWNEEVVLEQLHDAGSHPASLSTGLYFLTATALRSRSTLRSIDALVRIREFVLASGDEPLIAAYLLALGAAAGAVSGSERKVDLAGLKALMSPDRSYLDYWVLEAWGRAAGNPAFRECVAHWLEEVASDPELSMVVGVRRKLSWEVYRLVEAGYLWPGLPALLERGQLDSNPDVRLLTYKTLVLCYADVAAGPDILAAGLVDEHEDVLEWALRAHIQLFHELKPENRDAVAARVRELLVYPNFHVRRRANALMELCGGA